MTRIAPGPPRSCSASLGAGDYDAGGRLFWLGPAEVPVIGNGTIAVVCAGTADLPVAEEAAVTRS